MSFVLTLVAAREHAPLTSAQIARARDVVRGAPPVELSSGEAADVPCAEPPDLGAVRAVLESAAVDVLSTRMRGRRKALLVADMDSTIVTGETLDELAALAGVGEAVAAITRRSMNGELDFAAALRERVAMLRGAPLSLLETCREGVRLSPGARTVVATMRARGATCALVSGGFTAFTAHVAALCGFDVHRANVLLDDGERLTGAVAEPVLDRDAKLLALRELAAARNLRPSATLAVGDGANDLAMLGAAGLGVAYHAKPVVAAAAANRIEHSSLRTLLFAQGYPAASFSGDQ